jgi:small-conductance mechanosensitive channel
MALSALRTRSMVAGGSDDPPKPPHNYPRIPAVPDLMPLFTKFVNEILGVVAVLVVALLLSQAIKRLVNLLRDHKHVSALIATRLHAVRRWLITLMTMLVVMEALGIFRGTWALVSTILAALALGFVASWSVLSNATAAVLILIFRPFRVGDEVEMLEITNGFPLGGRVIDMNLFYTTLAELAPVEKVEPVEPVEPVERTEPTAAGAGAGAGAVPEQAPAPQTITTSPPGSEAVPTTPPRLIRVPNNMFFQRPVRTRSGLSMESKAPFFSRAKG